MREILFRAKRYNGDWVEGNLFIPDLPYTPTQICIGTNIVRISYDVIPETVGEFTGLYNGAGQKIFEGDIVRFEGELYRVRREDETPGGYWASTDYILQHIGRNDYMSFVDTIDDYSNEICVEIIGNIHDNPELLKKSEDTE